MNIYTIVNAGKLTQQLIVNYYCRTEVARLEFIQNQQAKLRVETYTGNADALFARKVKDWTHCYFIFYCNWQSRNMMQNYQDAMAMLRKFGKPDIYSTFTCDPLWPEIPSSIHHFETANDRPDVTVRVFNEHVSKDNALLQLINKTKFFDEIQTYLCTNKLRKKGLPHVHILLSLRDNCKFGEISDKDKVDYAEFSDINDTILYNLIQCHMVQGPCCSLNPNSICMIKGKYKKKLPKDFLNEAKENVNGSPLYKGEIMVS